MPPRGSVDSRFFCVLGCSPDFGTWSGTKFKTRCLAQETVRRNLWGEQRFLKWHCLANTWGTASTIRNVATCYVDAAAPPVKCTFMRDSMTTPEQRSVHRARQVHPRRQEGRFLHSVTQMGANCANKSWMFGNLKVRQKDIFFLSSTKIYLRITILLVEPFSGLRIWSSLCCYLVSYY